jgi:ZIP family zinc transporter
LSGVLQALVAGLVTASSLLVGGLVAVLSTPREHTLALVMAFGAGVLLSAVACDLVLEALDTSGGPGIPLGNAAGALTFYAGDRIIDRAGGGRRKAVRQPAEQGSPRAIVLGTVLDGVPESIVVGLTLLVGGGVSLALLVAAFLSNVPEAVAGTSGLAASGVRNGRIMVTWALITAVSGIAALAGYALLGSARLGGRLRAGVRGGCGADHAGRHHDARGVRARAPGGGLATTLGFALAFTIAYLEQGG